MENFSPSISFLLDGVFERTQGIKVPFERVKSDFCIDVSLSTIIILDERNNNVSPTGQWFLCRHSIRVNTEVCMWRLFVIVFCVPDFNEGQGSARYILFSVALSFRRQLSLFTLQFLGFQLSSPCAEKRDTETAQWRHSWGSVCPNDTIAHSSSQWRHTSSFVRHDDSIPLHLFVMLTSQLFIYSSWRRHSWWSVRPNNVIAHSSSQWRHSSLFIRHGDAIHSSQWHRRV